jgi:hypothetical protein
MSPHSQHLHRPCLFQNLVDKPVLDVDSTGICPGQIANKLLIQAGSDMNSPTGHQSEENAIQCGEENRSPR